MLPNGVAIAGPHGEEVAFRQRVALGVSAFRIQLWTAPAPDQLLCRRQRSRSDLDVLPDRLAVLESLQDGRRKSLRAIGVDLESAAR